LLEVLNLALVLLRRGTGFERPKVAAAAGLRILLARVDAVFAGSQFADHRVGTAGSPRNRTSAALCDARQ
jgi:hypothetical protein